MRLRQDPRLDLRAILEHGLAVEPPDPWWQRPGPDGIWRWHASELMQCTRMLMLRRAGLATDVERLESKLTMLAGKTLHRVAEDGIRAFADGKNLRIVAVEQGMEHPTLPLAAKPDLCYEMSGSFYVIDYKSESSYAAKHRREERAPGAPAVRFEHQIQGAAQAVTWEAACPGLRVEEVFMAYVDREHYDVDVQPIMLDDELRAMVPRRVADLELCWSMHAAHGWWPSRLPTVQRRDKKTGVVQDVAPWNCKPRGPKDPRGFYCNARTACMEEVAPS